MALTDKHRAALHVGLRAVIDDEEAVGEMLAHFPSREEDQPATRADLERFATREDLERLATEVDRRFAAVDRRFDGLDRYLERRFDRADVRFAEVERTVEQGYGRVRDQAHRDLKWFVFTVGGMFTLATAVISIVISLS